MSKHFGDTDLGHAIGVAIVIMAVFLSFGGCIHLAEKPADEVKINSSFNK